jgi:hypothetical protein
MINPGEETGKGRPEIELFGELKRRRRFAAPEGERSRVRS